MKHKFRIVQPVAKIELPVTQARIKGEYPAKPIISPFAENRGAVLKTSNASILFEALRYAFGRPEDERQ